MRICFLTHYFPPEVGAPQTRIEVLARTLAGRGDKVTVHTCVPHYPSGVVQPPYRNRPWQIERRDGIEVVRSAVYPAANRGFTRRLADHASFAVSALATAPLTGPMDVVVGETPPLFTAAAGAVYAQRKRAAYVTHVADRWPASAVALGALRNPRAIAAASALERWVYERADRIVAPTEGIAGALAATPEADWKVRRVVPVVDLRRFDAAPTPDRPHGALRLLYAGTIGLAHRLEVLVEASRLAGPAVVETTIAGDGADARRIRELVDRRRVRNVRVVGAVAADEVPRLYARCDASAVLLRDLEIFRSALPTKMLEAMAAGRPLLLAARGESARVLTRAGAGIVVAPEDPRALAEACRRLYERPELRLRLGLAARRYAEAHLGAERATDQWAEILTDAARARRRPAGSRRNRSARAAVARHRAG